jgi:hypothetical protein
MKQYQMTTAQDGITWVSLQPLLEQTMLHLDEAKKIDITVMSDDEKRGIDFTLLSMEAVVNFLRSLIAEHLMEEELQKRRSNSEATTNE